MSVKKIFSLVFVLFAFLLMTVAVSAQNGSSLLYTEPQSAGNNSYTTNIRLMPQEAMSIQGYEMELTFDTNAIQVTDIKYLVGRFSEGLGDTNDNLQKINSTGKIQILGEVPTAVGEAVSMGTAKDFVQLTYTVKDPSAQAKINVTRALFYKINQDGSLSSIQVTGNSNSTTNNVSAPQNNVTPNTPANKSTPWWLWIVEFFQNLIPKK